jgi:Ca2+/Na+ antiporter
VAVSAAITLGAAASEAFVEPAGRLLWACAVRGSAISATVVAAAASDVFNVVHKLISVHV